MKKDLKYYLNLEYPIEVKKLSDEEGGGYMATVPQLGRNTFIGDGETMQEAVDNLNVTKKDWFKNYLEQNINIPEPINEDDDDYSGKFVVRIPKEMHRILSIRAKANNVSLNLYVNNLLARYSTIEEIDLEHKIEKHYSGPFKESNFVWDMDSINYGSSKLDKYFYQRRDATFLKANVTIHQDMAKSSNRILINEPIKIPSTNQLQYYDIPTVQRKHLLQSDDVKKIRAKNEGLDDLDFNTDDVNITNVKKIKDKN